MKPNFIINQHEVHLWRIRVQDLVPQEAELLSLLNPDEVARAERFYFPIHKQRYIIAHGILRRILSLYLNQAPQTIAFTFGPRKKPYLKDNDLGLQFNLSHSDDMAVYALTRGAEIGVDLEKIKEDYQDKQGIAERYFSHDEFLQLSQLPENEKAKAFYYLWACKEAITKALGEGLYISLGDFSVSLAKKNQSIVLRHHDQEYHLHVESFFVDEHYQSAFAVNQKIDKTFNWQWLIDGPRIFSFKP